MNNKYLKLITVVSIILMAVNTSAKEYYKCTKINEEARIKSAWGNPIPRFSFESCLSIGDTVDKNSVERKRVVYGVDFGAASNDCMDSRRNFYVRSQTVTGFSTKSDQDYINDYGKINWNRLISKINIDGIDETILSYPNAEVFVTRKGVNTIATIEKKEPFAIDGFQEKFNLIFNISQFKKYGDNLNRDIACVKLN